MISTSLLLLLASSAIASTRPEEVVILFTGDARGEVAPCGCSNSPQGGIARRKVALSKQEPGASLVVDAGNALFQYPGVLDDVSKAKAELMMSAMGQMRTAAMAVGLRDLNGGVGFLKQQAQSAHVELLSANLVDASGKRLFAASRIINVKGVNIGLVGVSFVGTPAGIRDVKGDRAELAMEEARRLRQRVDVVVVLAAMPYQEALALASSSPKVWDVMIQSQDSRGALPPQVIGSSFLLSGGDRARQIGQLTLFSGAQGQFFVNLDELDKEKALFDGLQAQIAVLKGRLEKTKATESRKLLHAEIQELASAQAVHRKNMDKVSKPQQKSLKLQWLPLGEEIPEDSYFKSLADKLSSQPN